MTMQNTHQSCSTNWHSATVASDSLAFRESKQAGRLWTAAFCSHGHETANLKADFQFLIHQAAECEDWRSLKSTCLEHQTCWSAKPWTGCPRFWKPNWYKMKKDTTNSLRTDSRLWLSSRQHLWSNLNSKWKTAAPVQVVMQFSDL